VNRLLTVGLLVLGFLGGVAWMASCHEAHAQSEAVAYSLDHAADANGVSRRFLRCVAAGESGFFPGALGDYGRAHGLMQFHMGTWNANAPRYGFAGYSPYHAWASAHVAAGMIGDGMRSHWSAARRCGSEWW
jgi:hypothetical protein